MKLLLDTCVWGGSCESLRKMGHDVIWGGEWDEDSGDDEILESAHKEDAILITLDKDFGELVFLQEEKHNGIIRLVNLSAKQQSEICLRVLDLHGKDL